MSSLRYHQDIAPYSYLKVIHDNAKSMTRMWPLVNPQRCWKQVCRYTVGDVAQGRELCLSQLWTVLQSHWLTGRKTKRVADLNISHFGETHQQKYGADKRRNILRVNMGFESMIIRIKHANSTQRNFDASDDWYNHASKNVANVYHLMLQSRVQKSASLSRGRS